MSWKPAIAVLLAFTLIGVSGAASAQPSLGDSPTSTEGCTGSPGFVELCEEHNIGSYCLWIEVLGERLHDKQCIYWPS